MNNIITLATSLCEFQELCARCEGRAGSIRIDKDLLRRFLSDQSKLLSAAETAGFTIKETEGRDAR